MEAQGGAQGMAVVTAKGKVHRKTKQYVTWRLEAQAESASLCTAYTICVPGTWKGNRPQQARVSFAYVTYAALCRAGPLLPEYATVARAMASTTTSDTKLSNAKHAISVASMAPSRRRSACTSEGCLCWWRC